MYIKAPPDDLKCTRITCTVQ